MISAIFFPAKNKAYPRVMFYFKESCHVNENRGSRQIWQKSLSWEENDWSCENTDWSQFSYGKNWGWVGGIVCVRSPSKWMENLSLEPTSSSVHYNAFPLLYYLRSSLHYLDSLEHLAFDDKELSWHVNTLTLKLWSPESSKSNSFANNQGFSLANLFVSLLPSTSIRIWATGGRDLVHFVHCSIVSA